MAWTFPIQIKKWFFGRSNCVCTFPRCPILKIVFWTTVHLVHVNSFHVFSSSSIFAYDENRNRKQKALEFFWIKYYYVFSIWWGLTTSIIGVVCTFNPSVKHCKCVEVVVQLSRAIQQTFFFSAALQITQPYIQIHRTVPKVTIKMLLFNFMFCFWNSDDYVLKKLFHLTTITSQGSHWPRKCPGP